MNINDRTIFEYSILSCIGNKIYSSVIFSRVIPIHVTNTTNKGVTIELTLELHQPQNYKGNHMSLDINIDNGTIFQCTIYN